MTARGPLDGVAVLELAGLGAVPVCGMLLADLGADVVRVDRLAGREVAGVDPDSVCGRGKRSACIDVRSVAGAELVVTLARSHDVVIEGFRPGVAEALGVGPDRCLAANPALVFARACGWGAEGSRSADAGHDINYLAMSGVLHAIGPGAAPVPPLALVADISGGALLALGIVSAVLHARATGHGQVVEGSIAASAALMTTPYFEMLAGGVWVDRRESNLVDGGAPFYRTYETADGKFVAVGAVEPQFYAELLDVLGLDPDDLPAQMDVHGWPELGKRFAARIRERTRDEWERAATADACLTPVLSLAEAPHHPGNAGRFVDVGGIRLPVPSPAFSAIVGDAPAPPPRRGQHTREVISEAGISADACDRLLAEGVIGDVRP